MTIAPRYGRTTIHIEEPLAPLAGGVFGVLLGGMGAVLVLPISMSAASAIGASGGAVSAAAGAVGAGAGFLGGAYLIARALYGRIAARRGDKLQSLMTRLAGHVAASVARAQAEPAPDRP